MSIHLDVRQLESTIANFIATYPDVAEDMELRADMLEGETNLHDVLAKLVDKANEAKAMAGAIKVRMQDLDCRKARYEHQEEIYRALIQQVMERADLPKVQLPEATLSLSWRKPSPVITDEKELPDECVKVVRKPDMTTIKAWCENGNIPDGVTIGNGKQVLTVRVK